MHLRRAVSSMRSGRAPVGYPNFVVAIKVKNLFPHQEEVLDSALLIAMCPFLSAGHTQPAPLPLMVVVMVVLCGNAEHRQGV
ncbi:MAG TPA: hypothetical protein VGQ76_15605 [Thermoanaerobaculia bacterium]|jgi:hypothetical protein|nr:hypothetical protein [Thermoanaerobaculia bacterium]